MQTPANTGMPGAAAGGSSAMAPIRIGGREINPNKVMSTFSRTFFCLGPVCLRSGIGPGVGVGCGVGVIRGPMVPLGGEAGSLDFLRQLPGGYQIMNVLKTITRKFPGSKTGVGCGVGAGFGFGIGIAPAGGGGGGMGNMMGGMGGGMGGMGGGMGGMGGGMGGMGGGMGQGGYGGGGAQAGMGMGAVGGAAVSGGAVSGAGQSNKKVEELGDRVKRVEDKLSTLEEKVNMSLKMRELEERLSSVEGRKRR